MNKLPFRTHAITAEKLVLQRGRYEDGGKGWPGGIFWGKMAIIKVVVLSQTKLRFLCKRFFE